MSPLQFYCLLVLLSIFGRGSSRDGIVGGQEAAPHSRPYMVSLQVDGIHDCGGVLLREDFVLTAAHCDKSYVALLGAHSLKDHESSKQRIEVAKSIPYPTYKTGDLENDIQLLKLKSNATLNCYVSPIPVKDCSCLPRHVLCSTAGWGDMYDNYTFPDRLREVNTTVIGKRRCAHTWPTVTRRMICATDHGAVQGFCSGDSGGPLVCDGVCEGVVSFSHLKCGDPRYPDVYTRVCMYNRWIRWVMRRY
ncbi:mast cell protease 1A-like [Erpetoichthys calabaricus]|uniref:trypsin n=1 Tax=Erpetoichthys calabaricus TaxID=27687 RepID=A0A8C4TGA0_ERPCA|nr:mast cell protease 1A-like [Erpetoichthys calabaricus]